MLNKKEANFYKISENDFYKMLPKLLESIVARGNKILILTEDEEQIKSLDDLLWLYTQLSFLPHATYKDQFKEDNAIYITNSEQDNANHSNFIAIISENYIFKVNSNFEKYLFFYNERTVNLAKERAKKFVEMGGVCNFITQDRLGQWIKSSDLL